MDIILIIIGIIIIKVGEEGEEEEGEVEEEEVEEGVKEGVKEENLEEEVEWGEKVKLKEELEWEEGDIITVELIILKIKIFLSVIMIILIL